MNLVVYFEDMQFALVAILVSILVASSGKVVVVSSGRGGVVFGNMIQPGVGGGGWGDPWGAS